MKQKPNITFFLGAGASYHACPIWGEQAEKMVYLARNYFNQPKENFSELYPSGLNERDLIVWFIGYFGSKALKFGTIDTYAKKLNLNSSVDELARLKLAVSVFFTIWQLTDDTTIKSRENLEMEFVDRRYINLLAAVIERKYDTELKIKENINFVSWNYDLQVEYAFKAFHRDTVKLDYLIQNANFSISESYGKPLKICHLNGYHGFYQHGHITKNGLPRERHFLDRSKSNQINDILDELSFLNTSQDRGKIDITNHINYAWESNDIADKTREEAKRIFSETDILVIIGYSFPNFNKEIDMQLFRLLKGRETTIYYQDPNASESFIHQLVNPKECTVICETAKLDNFILPYEF